MADDDKQASEDRITPAGATELEENALDEAAGGLLPASEASSNFQKVNIAHKDVPGALKAFPGDLLGKKLPGGR